MIERFMMMPLLLLGAAQASAQQGERATWPYEDAVFKPIDPKRPELAQIAVLRGDPATGPSDMLMRMGKGQGVSHVHTADYRLVVIEGVMSYRDDTKPGEEGRYVAGGYWFQRGGDAHTNSCLVESCTMFISWSGKRDGRLPDPPPKR